MPYRILLSRKSCKISNRAAYHNSSSNKNLRHSFDGMGLSPNHLSNKDNRSLSFLSSNKMRMILSSILEKR
jgi:hypothetical protein